MGEIQETFSEGKTVGLVKKAWIFQQLVWLALRRVNEGRGR